MTQAKQIRVQIKNQAIIEKLVEKCVRDDAAYQRLKMLVDGSPLTAEEQLQTCKSQ